MRVRKVVMTMVLALSLLFVAAASADSVTTDFESFTTGSVNAQDGWTATGPYDQGVVAPGINSGKALRASSLLASGSFGDWIFSKPVTQKAWERGEPGRSSPSSPSRPSVTRSKGERVALSFSPDNGQGARMSYVRLEDTPDGVRVFFAEYPNPTGGGVEYTEQWIATLDHSIPHTIGFAMSLVPGEANDVVTVTVDGVKKVCGTSWENYYRYSEHGPVQGIDRLIIQARGDSTDFGLTAEADRGFLIDNVSTLTAASGGPKACPLPTGPAGPAGATGAAGTPGAAGATTTVMTGESAVAPKLIGNTKRTIHAPLRKGERFISARATLRNKRLPVHGRHITVDLRGKVVGNYNVFIVASYKTKSGKIHVHRSHRSLSVTRALSEARTPG